MQFIVKKLGGENAALISKSAKNIYDDFQKGNLQAIVVSAMRSSDFNTTDHLLQIGKLLSLKDIDKQKIFEIINKIKKFHIELLDSQILCSKQEIIDLIKNIFDDFEENISYYIKNKKIITSLENDYTINSKNKNFSIIGFGEYLSAKIISKVIDDMSLNGVCSKAVDLGNLINNQSIDKDSIFNFLGEKIANIVEEKIKENKIPIFSGYIGLFEKGIEKTIGRGYSDATAAIIAVGLSKLNYDVIIEIQKSVKGLLSADPRMLENSEDAVLLEKVDYITAREITGDGGAKAKLLHNQTLRDEVQQASIKIHLFDPFSGSKGSFIVDDLEKTKQCSGISFIGGKDDVIFLSISSAKMFESGILAKIFNIVKDYFSVDIVSTSETEITFTINKQDNDEKSLKEMIQKIRKVLKIPINSKGEFIEYAENKALIFCIGPNMKDRVGLLSKVAYILGKSNINIELISQGRLQRAIVIGVDKKDLKKSINLLHNQFIKCAV